MKILNKILNDSYKFINIQIPTNNETNFHYVSYHFFNVSGADILFLYLLTNLENDVSRFVTFFFLLFV